MMLRDSKKLASIIVDGMGEEPGEDEDYGRMGGDDALYAAGEAAMGALRGSDPRQFSESIKAMVQMCMDKRERELEAFDPLQNEVS